MFTLTIFDPRRGHCNTLFHGKAENSVVIHFRHEQTIDTAWGGFHLVV
ncbi:MAG TPA: hypothetical protein VGQ76_06385 [Thermoanaerobaculia bacterium]|nr:hypothetical protein [Thermoanaerobaculia bacterium]